jgi:hypothetical protein
MKLNAIVFGAALILGSVTSVVAMPIQAPGSGLEPTQAQVRCGPHGCFRVGRPVGRVYGNGYGPRYRGGYDNRRYRGPVYGGRGPVYGGGPIYGGGGYARRDRGVDPSDFNRGTAPNMVPPSTNANGGNQR